MPIFVGIDVAMQTHWVTAVDEQARVVHDGAVANDQAALVAFAGRLKALGDEVTVAMDGTGSIATFLGAVLAGARLALAHVPGIAVNRAGQGYAGGERKSEPRDARTIADLAPTRPRLRPILRDDAPTTALRLRVSRRGDLVVDQTRRLSRLRQLLRKSLPGMGVVLAAELNAGLGAIARFASAGALAAAAGLAPILRQSGRSRTLRPAKREDRARKRALFQSAFCAVMTRDPDSLASCQRKRRDGKLHTQAIIALARRRVAVLWAMLRTREPFRPTQMAA